MIDYMSEWFRSIDRRIWYCVWAIIGVCAIAYSIQLDREVIGNSEKSIFDYTLINGDIYERNE